MSKQIGRWLITVLAVAGLASAAAADRARQEHFATADGALDALVAAERADDQARLLAIFGADGARLIRSGDPVEDKRHLHNFVAAYDEGHRINAEGDNKAIVIVGKHDWPLPIPLVRDKAGWRFDTLAGEQEILDRRIGHNELKVIDICREYVQAQREYAALKPEGEEQFARVFISTQGHKNGLYWPAAGSEPESPFGPLVAEANASGYAKAGTGSAAQTSSRPYYGYYFRILTGQGPHAPGGTKNYWSART